MTNKEEWYMGFLGNVDSTIMEVKLKNNFSIEKMTVKEYEDFISDIKKEKKYNRNIDGVLLKEYPIINEREKSIYFIKTSSKNYFDNMKYPNSVISLLRLSNNC